MVWSGIAHRQKGIKQHRLTMVYGSTGARKESMREGRREVVGTRLGWGGGGKERGGGK